MARRFPEGASVKVRKQVEYELKLIADLNYEPYFLTVFNIVKFARSRGILCQGRGSAANSAVCYCLDITEIDPERSSLLFERFISKNAMSLLISMSISSINAGKRLFNTSIRNMARIVLR